MSLSLFVAAAAITYLAPGTQPERPAASVCKTCLNDEELGISLTGRKPGASPRLRPAGEAQGQDQLRLTGSAANVAQDRMMAQMEGDAMSQALNGPTADAPPATPFGNELIVSDPGSTATITSDYRTGVVQTSF